MKEVNAAIITIGDELLIGQTIDTNSAFIAQELNKIGIWVKRRVAIGDVRDEILTALKEQGKDCDVIIITGGLGPTADDITKPTLCEFFDSKLVVDEGALQNVKDIFTKLNRPVIERNLKQAEVPDNCVVLQNKRGTAPGMWWPIPDPSRREGPPAAQPQPVEDSSFEAIDSLVEDPEGKYGYHWADPYYYGMLKEYALKYRSKPTKAEEILWEVIKGKKLGNYKFRRQHIIDKYITDIVCLDKRLVIEIDGLIHQLPENITSDQERTFALEKKGFKLIRFSNDAILDNLETTLSQILFELNDRQSIKEISDLRPPFGGQGASSSRGPRAIYISLPGVPHEMKGLMNDSVIPQLQESLELPAVVHKTLLTSGIGESMIAEAIADFENNLPSNIKLAYLPAYGLVKLRLTCKTQNKTEANQQVQTYFDQLKVLVKDWMVADEDITLEEAVSKLLISKQRTVSTAESCTGGYIAHLITSKAGSSTIFNGSVVSYANEVKGNLLGVSQETLKKFGAVSEETVTEMVRGALNQLKTDYAIATSGIMGPGGGSPEKPVGTVWIAVASHKKIKTIKSFFRFDRSRNIELAAHTALSMLYRFVKEQEGE